MSVFTKSENIMLSLLVFKLLNPDENTKVTSDGMELFVLVA